MYYIYYKYRSMAWEIVDEADDQETADYLLSEYKLAYMDYGSDCQLKIVQE